jgi:hypothetical protein
MSCANWQKQQNSRPPEAIRLRLAEHLIQLLRDVYKGRTLGQLLQLVRTDISASRADTTENILQRISDRATIID